MAIRAHDCALYYVYPRAYDPDSNSKFDRCITVGRYLGIGAMPGGSGEQRANYDVCASSPGLR